MWVFIWISAGIFFWLAGYFTAGVIEDNGATIQKALLRPPFYIYLICGRPKAPNIPQGVISVRALMSQLQGILFLSYGVIYYFLAEHNLSLHIAVLIITTLLIYVFSWWLYKLHPYNTNAPR